MPGPKTTQPFQFRLSAQRIQQPPTGLDFRPVTQPRLCQCRRVIDGMPNSLARSPSRHSWGPSSAAIDPRARSRSQHSIPDQELLDMAAMEPASAARRMKAFAVELLRDLCGRRAGPP